MHALEDLREVMTNDDLTKTWIPHLRGQFERGRPILFTGAGFSLGVKNIAEETLASYDAMRMKL